MIDHRKNAERANGEFGDDLVAALAAQLTDMDQSLSIQLLDVSDGSEVRALRIEHFVAAIRAWADLHEVRL